MIRAWGRCADCVRLALKLTITEVARRAGISRQRVAQCEQAEANPLLNVIKRIATALGLTGWRSIQLEERV